MAMTVTSAKITTEKGVLIWRCPNCDQKFDEIIGTRVVIRVVGRVISLNMEAEPDPTCFVCGQTSAASDPERSAPPCRQIGKSSPS